MTYHTDIYNRNSSNYTDYTSYPVTHDIGGEPVISGGDTIITYCRLAIKNDYFTSQNVALPIYLN